jgi:putative ABC transport system substrate-binding protein
VKPAVRFLARLAVAALAATSWSGDRSYDAVVAYRSGSEAYQQAIEGMREALQGSVLRIEYIDLASASGAAQFAAMRAAPPRLITILGAAAWESADEAGPNVLPALIPRQELKSRPARRAGAVYADVPLTILSERLRAVFPGKSRLGLIHRPPGPGPDAAALAHLRQAGFDLQVVECRRPDGLLTALGSLGGKVDFVITEPDAELYNSATVKPLVLASLEKRLPIVGFSAAFVRAGALAGVYPDFRELGRQTGELTERILAGKSDHNEEEVHKVIIAVNQTVARLMGISPAEGAEVVILK